MLVDFKRHLPRHVWLSLLIGVTSIHAHEASRMPVPEEPGWQLGTSAVISHAWADSPWPTTRLPGILGAGSTPEDRRGVALEHATLAAGLRLSPQWSAALVAGWHDKDPAHVEMAWIQHDRLVGEADAVEVGAGRRHLPMGSVLENGGHFDRFGAMPLAKRGVLDGDWIDDGVLLHWQRDHEGVLPWLEALDVGLWRGAAFPGGKSAAPAPALHARVVIGALTLDTVIASLRPSPRAARVQSNTAGHTHDRPSCDGSLVGVFCFDGRTDVVAGSLSWRLPGDWHRWQLEAAGLLRRDRGDLYSLNGDTTYSGTTGGYWADVNWRMNERFDLSARLEQLRTVQSITGRSALVVATDAGLTGSTRLQRQSIALGWTPSWRDLKVSLEAGRDVVGSDAFPFQVVRLIWTPSPLTGSP